MKIKIWVPTHDMRCTMRYTHSQVPREVVSALQGQHQVEFSDASSCDLNGMRNSALEQARAQGFDVLCMQDSDVYCVGEQGPLIQLAETVVEHDATACVAAVGLRQIESNRIRMNVYPFEVDTLYEVERAGTGAIAINIAKINKMAEEHSGPWFWREYEDERCTVQSVGQDIFFCYLVRSLGGRVLCDSRVETNHPCLNTDHLNYVPAIVKHVVSS